jgi:signal transduction histidine kinase
MGVWTRLWRAVIVFRIAGLAYAGALVLIDHHGYRRPAAGLAVLAAMVAWTAVATLTNGTDRGRRRPAVVADLAVCVALTVASRWIQTDHQLHEGGGVPLTTIWAAAPVIAAAFVGGPWGGAAGAAVISAAWVATRGTHIGLFGTLVLFFLVGVVGGYLVRLATRAEAQLAEAVRLDAATRERDRLARAVHDGVLQVLALVQRRAGELGGAGPELAALAGEQEVALRTLITTPQARVAGEQLDLRSVLAPVRSGTVQVSAPAGPVPLPGHAARETAAAVGAALDNVRTHVGAGEPAYVLVEDLGDAVVVTVRDDGPGIPAGRLEQAAAAGRLGVASSIRARVAELGGSVSITSAPGQGTEVEITVPRVPGGAG